MAVECMHIPVNTILHFQGAGSQAAIQKIKETYWTILKLNWTVWTVIQYINVNHVPLKVQCHFQSSGMFLYGWVGDCLRYIQFCLAAQNKGELFSKAIKESWTYVLLAAKIEYLRKLVIKEV